MLSGPLRILTRQDVTQPMALIELLSSKPIIDTVRSKHSKYLYYRYSIDVDVEIEM